MSEYKARFTRRASARSTESTSSRRSRAPASTRRCAWRCRWRRKWDHELAQFDVPTAFLNADVEEDVYMEMPKGFGKPGMVCRAAEVAVRAEAGAAQLGQAGARLHHQDMGWKATVSDPSLYFKRSRSGRLMLIYRFVDDMQGSYQPRTRRSSSESVTMLQERFSIKQMQTATWMLGMRITRDRKARTIKLDQELYVTKALERYGLQQCKRGRARRRCVGAATDERRRRSTRRQTGSATWRSWAR